MKLYCSDTSYTLWLPLVKTKSCSWTAIIRIAVNPLVTIIFGIKGDSTDRVRTTENQIIHVVYISRSHSEKTTITKALERYHNEITLIKKLSSQKPEVRRGNTLHKYLGKYSLASLAAEHVSNYRDMRLLDDLSTSSVRLELALLSHLYTCKVFHVHMLVIAPPNMAPSEIRMRIKGRCSSKLFNEFPHIKKQYWGRHFWVRGYFCAMIHGRSNDGRHDKRLFRVSLGTEEEG